jgi:hypothetical protein
LFEHFSEREREQRPSALVCNLEASGKGIGTLSKKLGPHLLRGFECLKIGGFEVWQIKPNLVRADCMTDA